MRSRLAKHGPAEVSNALRAQHPALKADAENFSPLETGTTTPKILPNGWFSLRVPSLPPKAASEKVEEPSVSICGPLQQSALVLRTRRLPGIRLQSGSPPHTHTDAWTSKARTSAAGTSNNRLHHICLPAPSSGGLFWFGAVWLRWRRRLISLFMLDREEIIGKMKRWPARGKFMDFVCKQISGSYFFRG